MNAWFWLAIIFAVAAVPAYLITRRYESAYSEKSILIPSAVVAVAVVLGIIGAFQHDLKELADWRASCAADRGTVELIDTYRKWTGKTTISHSVYACMRDGVQLSTIDTTVD